jgi:hypothetical protein
MGHPRRCPSTPPETAEIIVKGMWGTFPTCQTGSVRGVGRLNLAKFGTLETCPTTFSATFSAGASDCGLNSAACGRNQTIRILNRR